MIFKKEKCEIPTRRITVNNNITAPPPRRQTHRGGNIEEDYRDYGFSTMEFYILHVSLF